jgi:Transcriptional regulator
MSESPSISGCAGARQILQAAGRLFAENGFEGVSVNAIAEAAGVSKANVFHHFASKESLYLALLKQACAEWGEQFVPFAQTARPFGAQLREMARLILRRLCDEPCKSRLMLREILENGALRGEQLSTEIFAPSFEMEMAIFRRAAANGELRPGLDPVIAWVMTLSVCVFYFQSREVLRHNPAFAYADDPDAYVDQVCDVLMRGIASSTAIAAFHKPETG